MYDHLRPGSSIFTLYNSYINLIDYRSRFMDPGISQFIQADTMIPDLSNPQTRNRYSYVQDRPTAFTDPTGHDPYWCDDPSASKSCYSDYSGKNIESLPANSRGSRTSGSGGTSPYPEPSTAQPGLLGLPMGSDPYVSEMCPSSYTYVQCFYSGQYVQLNGNQQIDPQQFKQLELGIYYDLNARMPVGGYDFIDRAAYDTPFWDANGTLGGEACSGNSCYQRSEVNYIAQVMWSAAAGQSRAEGVVDVVAWKACSSVGLCRRNLIPSSPVDTSAPTQNIAAEWSFAYDGDGNRTSQVYITGGNSTTTLYCMAGAYEVTGSSVKKYYSFASMTIAVNDGSGLKYLLTDQLGSVVAVANSDGSLASQQRYMPFGQVRTDVTSPNPQSGYTDFSYTGQRNVSGGLGLMDYHARFYDNLIGRFISPDSVVPDSKNSQSFNRYAYANNNPVLYDDPTGNIACADVFYWDGQCHDYGTDYFIHYLYGSYGVTISTEFTGSEVEAIYNAVVLLANAMGGADNFKKNLGGVRIDLGASNGNNGEAVANQVWLSKDIFTNPGQYTENPQWTIIHELAHAWDGNQGWTLSTGLEKVTGGSTNWFVGLLVQVYSNVMKVCDPQAPGCNNAGYYYGGIPPKGSDERFNPKEDFAESVATYVLGVNQDFINEKYKNSPEYPMFRLSSNFSPRWSYIYGLMNPDSPDPSLGGIASR
ncbi:MAG TPA: RHS repeat-associated core domain-containing protein [Anaerolineales bacterium]|nr:RHS repeat-associated core domain-containing protein [Anaerolineales bacterium]